MGCRQSKMGACIQQLGHVTKNSSSHRHADDDKHRNTTPSADTADGGTPTILLGGEDYSTTFALETNPGGGPSASSPSYGDTVANFYSDDVTPTMLKQPTTRRKKGKDSSSKSVVSFLDHADSAYGRLYGGRSGRQQQPPQDSESRLAPSVAAWSVLHATEFDDDNDNNDSGERYDDEYADYDLHQQYDLDDAVIMLNEEEDDNEYDDRKMQASATSFAVDVAMQTRFDC